MSQNWAMTLSCQDVVFDFLGTAETNSSPIVKSYEFFGKLHVLF